MPAIKSSSEIAKKWARVTPMRSDDYKLGVSNPKKDWLSSTKAANESWKKAIQEAASKDRFSKGLDAAGTEKWKAKAATKGVDRWGPGVQVAQSDYERGFAPYAEAIASTTLPPRYPKGDPRNIDRVAALAKALRAKKVGS
jgi:hypothetical protein